MRQEKMSKKRTEMCQMCTTKQTLKSGWGFKSPPQDQLKKKRFRRRWHTLSIVERCDSCLGKKGIDKEQSNKNDRNCLVLSYFKDESEQSVKGQFQVEKSSVAAVSHILEDCPSKFKDSEFIIRWELPKYGNRILYLIVDNENERSLWIKAFESYFEIQDHNADKNEEFDDKQVERFQPETNSKLQREIAASKRIRSRSQCAYVSDTESDTNASIDETDSQPPPFQSSPKHPSTVTREFSRQSNRSGGSFSHNNEEDEENNFPDGYNYLPPVRQLSLGRKSLSDSNTCCEDEKAVCSEDYMNLSLPLKQTSKTPESQRTKRSPVQNQTPSSQESYEYNFLPPQKKPGSMRREQDTKDESANLDNYHFLPSPQLASPTAASSRSMDILGVDTNGYNYLPPKDRSNSIEQQQKMNNGKLEHKKYVNRTPCKFIEETGPVSPTSDSYVNFAPMQQIKMIAKHNMKPSKPETDRAAIENSSYVNFKF